MNLTPAQQDIVHAPYAARIFLSGPAGAGKTTAGVERLRFLLDQGVPGESILVLTPQRTLSEPYFACLRRPDVIAGGQVAVLTVGGLARRLIELFWPLKSDAAGFGHPDRPPVFLTMETAQYYMAHIVRPLLDAGYFASVTIDRNRLYAQILDNLNKAAAIGFPHTAIAERLDPAWMGNPAQRRVFADAQDCAIRFRAFCLQHNLLDFSLQMDFFWEHLWPDPQIREFLGRTLRHVIYDNVEEDMPRAHDLLRDWQPELDSLLLIHDEDGGYRKFLGADPDSAFALRELCAEEVRWEHSLVSPPVMHSLALALRQRIEHPAAPPAASLDLAGALAFSASRFYPQMLDEVADEIRRLVAEESLPPQEIVVLAPYLTDALRFSLMDRLAARKIPVRSLRPSRSLREEPAARALLTLAALAHPDWTLRPERADVTLALMLALQADLVRADLLTQIVYRPREIALLPFEEIKPDVQERITFELGARYTALRDWLLDYRASPPLPLDHFLRRFFGEVLSQPGYGFHDNLDASQVAANLIESVQAFRQVTAGPFGEEGLDSGREYLLVLREGLIPAQYPGAWRAAEEDAVLVAPAYSFLMMNRPVEVQFWLDPGASGWAERLEQPLTHPYVLSRAWPRDRQWTDADEVAAARSALARLTTGLLRRCRRRIYLGITDLGEQGYEQRGPLLKAIWKVQMQAQEP